ncbi:hypothetical protein HYW46_01535 [Candidatus Daviesbacteria bacterium]|nr:hypothetical protein [Candidatus Daviesbacteria bacterium]
MENTRGDFGPLLGGTKGSIGTGFGRQTEHEVTRVRFYREEHRAALLTLRYDTAENLRAIGINVGGRNQSSPNPFPADGPGPGCPPPKGWRE